MLDHIFAVRQNERRIGFHQDSVQRNMRNCYPQILCPLFQLKHRTTDTKVISKFQVLLRNLFRAIEAVNHTAKLSGRVPSEDS